MRELRFTEGAKAVLRAALKAALRLGHNYIGTEHLLLGVVAADDELAERLAALGLDAELVERAVAVEIAQVQLERERSTS
jgi:ATP-dependent Clp protease ATP-binding subunit ClpC